MESKAMKGRGNGGGRTGVNAVSFESDFQFDSFPAHNADDSSERLANLRVHRPRVAVFPLKKAFLGRYP